MADLRAELADGLQYFDGLADLAAEAGS